MKRVWQHPEESNTGRRYWRSLGEYAATPEFNEQLGREFDPGIAGETDEQRESSRREFMKIMGGVAALSGLTLTSCRRPLQKIMPFTKHVEWVIPGKPLLYATAMPRPWGASPMVVVTHEGRPTHLQGNPLHPSGAGLDIFAQASILDLYNPERAQKPAYRGKEKGWSHFQKDVSEWIEAWKKDGGEGTGLLLNPGTSPTRAGLLADFAKACPKAKIYEYEPINRANQDAAVKAVLGEDVALLPKFAMADRLFSLDCDFVGLDTLSETATRDFMKRRAPEKKGESMNRLYILENRYTLTGGISDHRKPLAASLIPMAAAVLAEEVGKLTGDASLQQAAATLAAGADAKLREWIAPAAKDLFENKGKSLVLAGLRHSQAVHALVLGINNVLGAFGATLEAVKVESGYKAADATELTADLKGNKINHLIVLAESDPAYDLEDVFTLLKGLEKRPMVTHLTDRPKHTTAFSSWALPAAHYLESWSDVRSADGTYSVVQPMIQPLFDGASVNDILLSLLGRKKFGASVAVVAKDAAPAKPESDAAYEAVKATFAKMAGGWDDEKWNNTLRDGFLAGVIFDRASATFNTSGFSALAGKADKPLAPTKDSMEIVLTPDAKMWDGRYADNAWLQEAPDPVTKLTWDNAAWLSPKTFAALGLKKDGDRLKVTVGGASLNIPALSAPGHAHNSVTIPLGYGQKSFSVVGNERGFNAYSLRSGSASLVLNGAKVEKADGNYALAITQDNYTMEGRAQVREGTKDRFDKNETFAQTEGMDSHIPPAELTLYKGRVGVKSKENPDGFDYENEHQWGMVIDLAKCIGCSACIVACQSENNIPVVGKDQVARGRVMQWIRMDRYFSTSGGVEDRGVADIEELENPEMIHQPVACQQCESAPCETVCPVNATVHTEEGLNAMAYNRCIGTRYCANNCPYTARRFNYFDYNKRNPLIDTTLPLIGKVPNLYAGPLGEKTQNETARLQKNPNVTVRMRGVIEKCTYCVQRLETAKINQRRIGRDDKNNLRVPLDSVKTACQASCPAEAIEFGDLANKKSSVNRWKDSPRNYQVLKYIGTRPRTSYLARIRNINPDPLMPGGDRKVKTGEASLNKA